jgi:hypothetical protein
MSKAVWSADCSGAGKAALTRDPELSPDTLQLSPTACPGRIIQLLIS